MDNMLSKSDLVSLCLIIGCSGMNPKTCPGDPNCEILQKAVDCIEDYVVADEIQQRIDEISDEVVTHYEETMYGFEFGAALVSRMISGKKGWVVIGLETPEHPAGKEIQVYVTKTGKVRVFDSRGEWTAPKAKK